MEHVIEDFTGLDFGVHPRKVGKRPGFYPIAFNVRVRDGLVEPINKPKKLTLGLPEGNYQGNYAASVFSLVFIDGKAWIKNFAIEGSNYYQIKNLALDPDVEYIYAALVPASSMNHGREAGTNPSDAITLVSGITGTPQSVVVQDGINQPWIIDSQGNARLAQGYTSWTPDKREYVPIGSRMVHSGSVLYIVDAEGNKLLRSLTGRPLDFMVIIKPDGNRLDNEAEGGAAQVSHAVDFEKITCLASVGLQDNSIFVSSGRISHFVTPNPELRIFGEPRFNNTFLFSTGAFNQFSFVELLGDNAFIDELGVRSFNAIRSTKNEGQNASFSRSVNELFRKIDQNVTATIKHDNYGMFAMNSIHGPVVVIFDEQTNGFVSVDTLEGVDQIKMFSEIKVAGKRRLLFITEDNSLYEFDAGDGVERAQIYLGDFTAAHPDQQQVPKKITLTFDNVRTGGMVYATYQVDGKKAATRSRAIEASTFVSTDTKPFPGSDAKSLVSVVIPTPDILAGKRVGVFIEWDFQGSLASATLSGETTQPTVPIGVKA